MITMNRVFTAILIAFAGVWIWATVNKWVQPLSRSNHYLSIRNDAFLGFIGTMLVSVIAEKIQAAIRRRR
jgi:hypothetical protein